MTLCGLFAVPFGRVLEATPVAETALGSSKWEGHRSGLSLQTAWACRLRAYIFTLWCLSSRIDVLTDLDGVCSGVWAGVGGYARGTQH